MIIETEIHEYRGSKFIKLFEVDEAGKKKDKPVISFGLKKAKVILLSLKEISLFIEEHDKNQDQ